jgi:ATP-dependent DNA ligase
MCEALHKGEVPGGFNDDRTIYTFPTIRSTNSRGAVLLWTVRVRLVNNQDEAVPVTDEMLRQPVEQLAGLRGEITTESQQEGSKIRAGGKPTFVTTGKNLGRKNATNAITQALRDAYGRYNRQLKQKTTAATAGPPGEPAGVAPGAPAGVAPRVPRSREDGGHRPPPMLVKKINETRDATLTEATFAQGAMVQRKYNGVRLVADQRVLYSRTGGDYPGLAPIRDELEQLLEAAPPVPDELLAPPPGCPDEPDIARQRAAYASARVFADGELWEPGKSLRYISGQARREDDAGNLKYFVFDCFWPTAKAAGVDMPSVRRQQYLDLLFKEAELLGLELKHVVRVENVPANSVEEIMTLAKQFVEEGYEGAIARKNCAGYRYGFHNHHSSNLVKVKPLLDSEFTVIGFTEGTKGKDVGAVIWICEVDTEHVVSEADKTFAVVPKDMTYEERYRVFRCLSEMVPNTPKAIEEGGPAQVTRFDRDFYGKPLTVEYPERSSKTGKPTQGKAVTFRTYEDALQNDPLKRLNEECQ